MFNAEMMDAGDATGMRARSRPMKLQNSLASCRAFGNLLNIQ